MPYFHQYSRAEGYGAHELLSDWGSFRCKMKHEKANEDI